MSEINEHPPGLNVPATASATEPFPYHIIIDYGNQLMTIITSGHWTGAVDADTPITLTVSYDETTDKSALAFCFKLALPGEKVSASLSDGTVNYSILLSVPR